MAADDVHKALRLDEESLLVAAFPKMFVYGTNDEKVKNGKKKGGAK